MQKGQILVWIIVGSIIIVVAGGFLFYTNYKTSVSDRTNNRTKPVSQNPVVTSQTPQPTSSPSLSDASPAPTSAGETANWKTYTNNEYPYEIKYPSTLDIIESTGDYYNQSFNVVNLRNYPSEEEFKYKDAISITILSKTLANVGNLQKWLEDISIGPRVDGTTGPRVRKFSPIKVSSNDALVYFSGEESIYKNIAIYKNNNLIIFSLNPTGETGSSYDENPNSVKIFDQILSTFKFTQ